MHGERVRHRRRRSRCSGATSVRARTRPPARGCRPRLLDVARAIRRSRTMCSATTMRVNGVPYEIVGVMPEGFRVSQQRPALGSAADRPARDERGQGQFVEVVRQAQAGRLDRLRRTSTSRRSASDSRRTYPEATRASSARPCRSPTTTSAPEPRAVALHDARRGVLRAAHRLRERREPAARPRRAPHARRSAFAPRSARRARPSSGSSSPKRSCSSVVGDGASAIVVAYVGMRLFNRAIIDTSHSVLHRHSAAPAGAAVHDRRRDADDALLRRDPGVSVVARRHQRDPQGRDRAARRASASAGSARRSSCSRSRSRAACSSPRA